MSLSTGCRLLFATLSLALVTLAGCGSEVPEAGEGARGGGVKRIVILTNGSSPFWDAAAAGVNDAVEEFDLDDAGYKVVFDRGDFTVGTQLDKLKQYANSTDVVAVGISVTDDNSQALVDQMRALQKAGVKVITIDSDVDRAKARDARLAYIGTDNVVAGRELGKAARALKPEGANYAAFVGLKGASNAKARISGFQEGAGEEFEQKAFLADGGNADEAPRFVRIAIDQNEDVDLLLGIWSYNTPAIIQTVDALELEDKITVVGFDADPPSIIGMDKGQVEALLVQNPYEMGFQGVKLLKALVEDDAKAIGEVLPNRDEPEGDIHTTGLKVVVPDEGSPVTKDLFGPDTEFLTLSEFKEWLKQHALTGS
ncbi:MAG: substrate-binding domain-containing protein [Planctomycetes bacterium]|nr:substrate-binding domain-containing protein [Planctomycetota bacterium]